MRVNQVSTVTRYDLQFHPRETKLLLAHEKWRHRISVRAATNNKRHPNDQWGAATLTRTELSEVCDVLGVNSREWLAKNAERIAKLQHGGAP